MVESTKKKPVHHNIEGIIGTSSDVDEYEANLGSKLRELQSALNLSASGSDVSGNADDILASLSSRSSMNKSVDSYEETLGKSFRQLKESLERRGITEVSSDAANEGLNKDDVPSSTVNEEKGEEKDNGEAQGDDIAKSGNQDTDIAKGGSQVEEPHKKEEENESKIKKSEIEKSIKNEKKVNEINSAPKDKCNDDDDDSVVIKPSTYMTGVPHPSELTAVKQSSKPKNIKQNKPSTSKKAHRVNLLNPRNFDWIFDELKLIFPKAMSWYTPSKAAGSYSPIEDLTGTMCFCFSDHADKSQTDASSVTAPSLAESTDLSECSNPPVEPTANDKLIGAH
mmetsp:Transcript_27022/g.46084  ORF Transcript_27022/g.46084 Transcript_27022/m.46084 type:complete len:338 (+) Transcript_27022:175-1188(+)|eukprot:CAMPEP_0183727774 /NCGR_PEP_ID=MMETSP0737-20130205/26373_1 /TAXON_ID=385413 /ORGANISM="Thalassiosira miniscula, Strain CCMP1093" /LENGTH=337 /DNA_ID=CAMNT_0025959495 /DNA_START=213 /DNA_END=1226 /DNA_ORIENTATION=-